MDVFTKDPQAVLEWTETWAAWLADVGDTMVAATASVVSASGAGDVADLTIEATVFNTTAVTVWLSGGVANIDYVVNVHIVSANTPIPRQDDRRFKIKVRER
jgi:hypothetical protein